MKGESTHRRLSDAWRNAEDAAPGTLRAHAFPKQFDTHPAAACEHRGSGRPVEPVAGKQRAPDERRHHR
ncbi:MAG: hypothetical protein CVU25_06520, partial [Betaproteobacteria bacterium HGW-Betaproteobacteria-19]